jgi:hypothetical protein
MADRVSEEMLRSLIEQVKTFHTTRISEFGYWQRGYDLELTPEDGPLFQIYAGLGVLTRDMWLYLAEHPREDAGLFQKVIQPAVQENQQKFPETTIFQPQAQYKLPEGFTASAVDGHPTVTGLDDWHIVHEPVTKPGKRVFFGFYQVCREELCGRNSPYELLREGKVDEKELGMRVAEVFQRECFSKDPVWYPLIAFLAGCAIRKELENICEMITILFLTADPTDASRLRLGEELREIHETLQRAKLRERFDLVERLSVRPADLSQALLDVEPQIVHFSGHGTTTGELCFEDSTGKLHPIEPDALAALFEQFAGNVSCIVLNACFSEAQAHAIARHVDYVIGMNQAIGDKAAIAFAIGFYQALGAGSKVGKAEVRKAFKLGCTQIRLQNIPEHLTPVLVNKDSLKAH